MPINKLLGAALVVVGMVLLWQGWQAKQSLGSRISETLGSGPSDQALWLLGAGAVAVVVGAVLALRR